MREDAEEEGSPLSDSAAKGVAACNDDATDPFMVAVAIFTGV